MPIAKNCLVADMKYQDCPPRLRDHFVEALGMRLPMYAQLEQQHSQVHYHKLHIDQFS